MDLDLIRTALDKGERECGWNNHSKLDVLLDALDNLCDPASVILRVIERRIEEEKEGIRG